MRPSRKVLGHSEMTDWAGDIRHGLAKIRVIVRQPEVEHTVLENRLESVGRSPAEMSLKTRLRELLKT